MKTTSLAQKTRLVWNWIQTPEGKGIRLIKEEKIIPEQPSNSLYTFCNICVIAIKKGKELKGSIDREIDFLDPMSAKARKLAALSDIIGLQMIKLAHLGYKISRNMNEYKGKTIDDFINIYGADKRETWEFKRREMSKIASDFEALQDLMATQGSFYGSGDNVQLMVIKELETIYNEMSKGYLLLQTINHKDAVQGNV